MKVFLLETKIFNFVASYGTTLETIWQPGVNDVSKKIKKLTHHVVVQKNNILKKGDTATDTDTDKCVFMKVLDNM